MNNNEILNTWLNEDEVLTKQDCFVLGNLFFSNKITNNIEFVWKKDNLFKYEDFKNENETEGTELKIKANEILDYKDFLIEFLRNDAKYIKLSSSLEGEDIDNSVHFKFSLGECDDEKEKELIKILKVKIDSKDKIEWFIRGIFDNRGSADPSKFACDVGYPKDDNGKNIKTASARKIRLEKIKELLTGNYLIENFFSDLDYTYDDLINHKPEHQVKDNDQFRIKNTDFLIKIISTNKYQIMHAIKKADTVSESDFIKSIKETKKLIETTLEEAVVEKNSKKKDVNSESLFVTDLKEHFVARRNNSSSSFERTDEDLKKSRDVSDVTSRIAEELVYDDLKNRHNLNLVKKYLEDTNAGFDILEFGFDDSDIKRMYEVKKYNSFSFEMSKNELKKAKENPDNYYIALVDGQNIKYFKWSLVSDSIEKVPTSYKVTLREDLNEENTSN